MNYVFFGTPSFAAHFLKILIDNNFMPTAVVCNPDRPVGRKHTTTPPPVKILAQNWKNIQILQPEKLDSNFTLHISSLNPDFFLVFAYNKIFREELLNIPRFGTIGVHPSLLPLYRGPSPFQTALLEGEVSTGVSLYLLDKGADSGPIIAQSPSVEITNEDNFDSLALKLSVVGARLVVDKIPKFLSGNIVPVSQNNSLATYTKKFDAPDGFVDNADIEKAQSGNNPALAIKIHRMIRALNPEPGVWILKNNKRIKIIEAKILNGSLKIKKIQPEGKKPQTIP
jgi:methionyl-tRNA formyltransferase